MFTISFSDTSLVLEIVYFIKCVRRRREDSRKCYRLRRTVLWQCTETFKTGIWQLANGLILETEGFSTASA